MLTKEGCIARQKRLWAALPTKPDLLLITDPQHLFYFSNYVQSPFLFRSNDAGAVLILHSSGKSTLVADSMSRMYVDAAHADEKITPTWYDGKHTAPHREGLLLQTASDQLKKLAPRSVGLEYCQVPAGLFALLSDNKVQCSNIDALLGPMKRRKDADEIAMLRTSMKAGEAGMAAGRKEIHPGMTELEMYCVVQRAALTDVPSQAIVYGDFVTGKRTEQGGGPPSQKKIAAGELILLDFSTIIGQYRADFATTFVCEGKPTPRQKEMNLACLEAMDAGEKKLKAGVLAKDVDRAVRSVFESKHLAEHFTHHSGHGIGLGHPEAPFIVPESSDTLLAGDVVTLEPGLYIPNVGGMRFERNYLITETGFELLSHHDLRLEVTA